MMKTLMKNRQMKKQAALLLSLLLLAIGLLSGCGQKNAESADSVKGSKNAIVLNEVAHSIFYAPMYVAIEEGYFQDEGLDVTLVTGFGADKTMTALLSGEADIGFMGSESTLYTYLEGAEDYVINFAQLTQRAGNFLVAREPMDQFSWDMIKGSSVLGGRKGGLPHHDVTFEHIKGIYEWTSQKADNMQVFKYDEKIVTA